MGVIISRPPMGEGEMSDSDRRGPPSGISMVNAARGLKLLALLFFLLPWVTVSCADQTLVSMSGYELATGSVTAHNPLTGETRKPPDAGKPDLAVLVAAVLIAAALVLGFFLGRSRAALVAIAGPAAAVALIAYTVLIRIPARVHAGAEAEASLGVDRMQISEIVRVETAAGFWLTVAALLGAVVLGWLARRGQPPG